MKTISILVPKGAILGSIEGPRQVLTGVNSYFGSLGKKPLFHVELVGLTKETPIGNGLYTIHANKTINEVEKTDLIIIPAVEGDFRKGLEANQDFIPFIKKHYETGTSSGKTSAVNPQARTTSMIETASTLCPALTRKIRSQSARSKFTSYSG